jgi:hypothetical protein
VFPGDIVVADHDGVVVIPRHLLRRWHAMVSAGARRVRPEAGRSRRIDRKCIRPTTTPWPAYRLWSSRAKTTAPCAIQEPVGLTFTHVAGKSDGC